MFNKKCVYAGSFDPVTNGHLDIIGKCAMMFEEVIVAVGKNAEKHNTFPLETRLEMLKSCCAKYSGVTVKAFDGLLVDFLKQEGTTFYVRGVRDEVDEDYETRTFNFNSERFEDIQTIFIPASKETKKISSTFVKKLINEGKDVSKYVPIECLKFLNKNKR